MLTEPADYRVERERSGIHLRRSRIRNFEPPELPPPIQMLAIIALSTGMARSSSSLPGSTAEGPFAEGRFALECEGPCRPPLSLPQGGDELVVEFRLVRFFRALHDRDSVDEQSRYRSTETMYSTGMLSRVLRVAMSGMSPSVISPPSPNLR